MISARNPRPGDWFSSDPGFIPLSVGAVDLHVEKAIICFVGGCFERLSRSREFRNGRRVPRIYGTMSRGILGRDIVVYNSMVGAPATALAMETLIASGIREVVMLGLAGSLSKDCEVGDIVVPSWGLREEGTSFHYLPASVIPRPSKRLSEAVVRALGKQQATRGGVWTTDAPYRETRKKIRDYARRGIVAVDMECTALMSIAIMRDVKFAALLAVSDILHGDSWIEGFASDELKEAVDTMCNASVKALRT